MIGNAAAYQSTICNAESFMFIRTFQAAWKIHLLSSSIKLLWDEDFNWIHLITLLSRLCNFNASKNILCRLLEENFALSCLLLIHVSVFSIRMKLISTAIILKCEMGDYSSSASIPQHYGDIAFTCNTNTLRRILNIFKFWAAIHS